MEIERERAEMAIEMGDRRGWERVEREMKIERQRQWQSCYYGMAESEEFSWEA